MKTSYTSHRLFQGESALERAEERAAIEAAARLAAQDAQRLTQVLPAELKARAQEILRVPSRDPLFHEVGGVRRVNSVEFTRRLVWIREADQNAPVVKGFSFEFRPSNHGGWKPLRQPTPGRRSGAQRGSL